MSDTCVKIKLKTTLADLMKKLNNLVKFCKVSVHYTRTLDTDKGTILTQTQNKKSHANVKTNFLGTDNNWKRMKDRSE